MAPSFLTVTCHILERLEQSGWNLDGPLRPGTAIASARIEIVVQRDPVLSGVEIDGHVNGFSVTDTGVGFDEANLESFFTSDTQYKVGRGMNRTGNLGTIHVVHPSSVLPSLLNLPERDSRAC
jgi:hypothetical protein